MSRIGISYRPSYTPQQSQGAGSKTAKIDALKAEIASIKQKAEYGIISQEEARSQIAALEAKINNIESTPSNSVENSANIDSVGLDNNVNQIQDTNSAESPDSGSDSQEGRKENSQDSFFEQQALYNRAFHNL